jgi:hypothetical protein
VLGAEHPLARAEDRVHWLGRQLATITALLPVAGLAVLAGAHGLRAVVPAAALVEALLLAGLAGAAATVHERALELIAEGRGSLPLDSVRHRRARLLRPRHIRGLARAIEGLRREANCPYRGRPMGRPLYVAAVVREVDAQLAATVCVLRGHCVDDATVGRIERLLACSSSPLYGDEPQPLRQELARIHFGVVDVTSAPSAEPSAVAPASTPP